MILAVLLGCRLRREEYVGLQVGHIQQREGHLVTSRLANRKTPVPYGITHSGQGFG